ncbi:DUF3422 domain-containing protein [Lentzea kentuckyensis]|uniref:DUF3422 domain-containing protein n=1 Tax=Lentzea kentuckyensis TaxID=360086 RepID=UPI00117A77C6|nr:DUF3422 domain-containing protein [Lentzea kentuckyensis]
MNWRAVLVSLGLFVVLVTVCFLVVLNENQHASAPVTTSPSTPPWPTSTPDLTGWPITPTPCDPLLPCATPPTTRSATPSTTRFQLADGQVVYRAPSPMRVNEAQRVTVRVAGRDVPPDLTSGLPGTGRVSVAPAKVGSALTAHLSGPEFQITSVGGDDGQRELPDGGFAEWAWDVRPQKSGSLRLDFVLYVAKDTGGVPIHYRTYAHEVEVEVNFSYSFGKFMKDYGALTGLSVPVIAGAAWTFIRWLRKKREKPEPVEE